MIFAKKNIVSNNNNIFLLHFDRNKFLYEVLIQHIISSNNRLFPRRWLST